MIGCMLVLNFLFALLHLNLKFRLVVKLAMALLFVAVILKDNEHTRLGLFIGFLVNPFLTGVAVYIDQLHLGLKKKAMRAFTLGTYAEDICHDMAPEDFHKLFKSMKECLKY